MEISDFVVLEWGALVFVVEAAAVGKVGGDGDDVRVLYDLLAW